jgi:hypothetical protein
MLVAKDKRPTLDENDSSSSKFKPLSLFASDEIGYEER